MSAMLVFSGLQLVMLGLIGEYLGRMFLTVNQRPQSVVREVIRSVEIAEVQLRRHEGTEKNRYHESESR
jgi:hypothetical protein